MSESSGSFVPLADAIRRLAECGIHISDYLAKARADQGLVPQLRRFPNGRLGWDYEDFLKAERFFTRDASAALQAIKKSHGAPEILDSHGRLRKAAELVDPRAHPGLGDSVDEIDPPPVKTAPMLPRPGAPFRFVESDGETSHDGKITSFNQDIVTITLGDGRQKTIDWDDFVQLPATETRPACWSNIPAAQKVMHTSFRK